MPDTAASSYVSPTGEFTRDQRYITTRITADGRHSLGGHPFGDGTPPPPPPRNETVPRVDQGGATDRT